MDRKKFRSFVSFRWGKSTWLEIALKNELIVNVGWIFKGTCGKQFGWSARKKVQLFFYLVCLSLLNGLVKLCWIWCFHVDIVGQNRRTIIAHDVTIYCTKVCFSRFFKQNLSGFWIIASAVASISQETLIRAFWINLSSYQLMKKLYEKVNTLILNRFSVFNCCRVNMTHLSLYLQVVFSCPSLLLNWMKSMPIFIQRLFLGFMSFSHK